MGTTPLPEKHWRTAWQGVVLSLVLFQLIPAEQLPQTVSEETVPAVVTPLPLSHFFNTLQLVLPEPLAKVTPA